MSTLKLTLSACLFLLPAVQTQDCLQATGAQDNTPNLGDLGNVERIPHGHQVIVSSYEFQCCGIIEAWEADTYSNTAADPIDIQFQVWRPSPTVGSDGCYSLVGENLFTSVNTMEDGLISVAPPSGEQISVQPGDVVGYSMEAGSATANPGLALDNSYTRETVWYANTAAAGPSHCPFPVGSGRSLRTSTNVGPVIHASVEFTTNVCSPTNIPFPQDTTFSQQNTSSQHITSSITSLRQVQLTSTSLMVAPTLSTQSIHNLPSTTSHTYYNSQSRNSGLTITDTAVASSSIQVTRVSTIMDGFVTTTSNDFAVKGAGQRTVTVVPTASPSPSPAISTVYVIAILASGGGVVVFLIIVLLVVSFFVCRRVSQINKERQAVDPARFSRCNMEYNTAYISSPSSRSSSYTEISEEMRESQVERLREGEREYPRDSMVYNATYTTNKLKVGGVEAAKN